MMKAGKYIFSAANMRRFSCCMFCIIFLLAPLSGSVSADRSISMQKDSDAVMQATASESRIIKAEELSLKSDAQAKTTAYEGKDALYVSAGDAVCFDISIDRDDTYYVQIDYFIPESTLMTAKAALFINGDLLQDEMPIPAQWINNTDYKSDDFKNELYGMPSRQYSWTSCRLNSSLYQYQEGISFAFSAGENHVELEISETPVYISRITLCGKSSVMDYSDWLAAQTASADGASAQLITIEGEDYALQSNAQIHVGKSKNTNFFPFSPKHNVVNCLEGTSWEDAGDTVLWNFNVPCDGYYAITVKYRQSDKNDLPSWRNIAVDGVVPFSGFYNYAFDYTGDQNKNETLTADGEPVYFYFTAGQHSISLCSTAELSANANEAVKALVAEMNRIALNIRSVTGGKSDENRDWNIEKNIPTLRSDLEDVVARIGDMEDMLRELNGTDTVISTLEDSKTTIERYLNQKKGLNRLVNNIGVFAQASGSLAEKISEISEELLAQPLTVDRIYIAGHDTKLPAANVGVLTAAGREMQKLFYSYAGTSGDAQQVDSDALNVWVLGSAPQVETIKQLVSEQYGAGKVKVSVLQDESKLLLAVASGETPDVVLGGSRTEPCDLGIRGAAYDLTQFSDFKEYASQFKAAYFVPFIEGDAVFALPQTVNFYVTFYRSDILNSLSLTVPDTWDELINELPALYRNGMSVNTTIANAGSIKPLIFTDPFIQQCGGALYTANGLGVSFGDPETVRAFTLMTDLYKKYSMPITVSNFYLSFRNGTVPLGVSDIGTYLLLRTASSEINGAWGIAPAIGVAREDGTVNNDYPAVASPCYILNNTDKPDEAWAFLKWWMSTGTQLEFSETMCASYGDSYLWLSANLEALSESSTIPTEDKQVILEQLNHCTEIAYHPAWTLVSRALSNAWNDVVLSGEDTRTALDQAIVDENREIQRKLQEFGYVDDEGNVLREVEIATTEIAAELTGGKTN